MAVINRQEGPATFFSVFDSSPESPASDSVSRNVYDLEWIFHSYSQVLKPDAFSNAQIPGFPKLSVF